MSGHADPPAAALPRSRASSAEDLSEYTDADESLSSAPTEFLAEFLSALMLRDYPTALKYCRLILRYEPHNATAREFHPLIMEKIQLMREAAEDGRDSSSGASSGGGGAGGGVRRRVDDNGNNKQPARTATGSSGSSGESDSEGTTASYSSLEDDEADDNGNVSVPRSLPTSSVPADPTPFAAGSDSESPTEPAYAPPDRAATAR